MNLFNRVKPIFRRKPTALDIQDRKGLLRLQLRLGAGRSLYLTYTRLDQVSVLWGAICAVIFISAQFAPISWVTQALWWSSLSVVGIGAMFILAHFWVRVERLQWLLYFWMLLMLGGVALTDLAIALSWGWLLMHLCHLWLGLSALGYFGTAIGVRSRAFLFASFVHLFGLVILPAISGWQFLFTGLLLSSNLFLFAETQWDMRPPIEDFALLTVKEQQFNQVQQKLRQASMT